MPALAKTNGATERVTPRPATPVQRKWLRGGLKQPGGKLPLFDEDGQRYCDRTVQRCLENGWAETWFVNPLKPDWLVCKLTHLGRVVSEEDR